MNIVKRYIFLFISVFLLLVVLRHYLLSSNNPSHRGESFITRNHVPFITSPLIPSKYSQETNKDEDSHQISDPANCTISSCFSTKRCQEFTVTVHPSNLKDHKTTAQFDKLVSIVKSLPYYTESTEDACVTLFDIDTLDRDFLSSNFVRNLGAEFSGLDGWQNEHTNAIFFNVFSGTFPSYSEKVDFDFSRAVLAKSSGSVQQLRRSFDIGFPLININTYPQHFTETNNSRELSFLTLTSRDRFLLSFKGKRYVYGLGSGSRDSVHLLSNQRDVVMLTTCEHNRDWRNRLSPEELRKCEADIREYNRIENDYLWLLTNSTFCLVPRGRRLDSFRLLEVLKAGCIPVILSNEAALPFSEVINWHMFAVIADERLLTHVASQVRSIPEEGVNFMKSQGAFIYKTYLSSLEAILRTTFTVLSERVSSSPLPRWIWNEYPGAIYINTTFSSSFSDFPFWVNSPRIVHSQHSLPSLSIVVVRNVNESIEQCRTVIHQAVNSKSANELVFVSLVSSRDREHISSLSFKSRPIKFVHMLSGLLLDKVTSQSAIFRIHCSPDLPSAKEIDFAFSVWLGNQDRIVGYIPRSHVWSYGANNFLYSSRLHNSFSIIQLHKSIHHKYYYHLMRNFVSEDVFNKIQQSSTLCHDIVFNMLISHVTRDAPISLDAKDHMTTDDVSTNSDTPNDQKSPPFLANHNIVQDASSCLQWFGKVFGYMPLRRSEFQYTPI